MHGFEVGKRLGRPMVARDVEDAIRASRAAGNGQLAIARELGVGVSAECSVSPRTEEMTVEA
jgi:hypothetical protein